MQKLSENLDGRTKTTTPPDKGLTAGAKQWLEAAEALSVRNRFATVLIGLVWIGVIGWVNVNAFRELHFDYFYLLGCVVVGWLAGVEGALLCLMASGVFLYLAEAGGNGRPIESVFVTNSAVRLTAFAMIGWCAAKIGADSRDLERTVQQRTERLQREVEEHKETSEMLLEAGQLFKQLTTNITDVFWVTDPLKREVEFVSPAFERVWGRSCDALYRAPSEWLEGIHHEDRERVTRGMLNRQIHGEYDEEYRVERTDGAVRWVHDRAFPVKDQNGAVYRLVGIAEDVTERKRAEQLLQAERDIGAALSSTSDLNFALDRLLEIAMQLEGIDCGGVYLLDNRTGTLNLETHCGLSGAFLKRISHYRADAVETRLALTGKSTYVRQDQMPRNLEVLWGSEGLQALAVVPVQHKGAVLGMLTLGSYGQTEIPPRTRVGLEMIASQVAGAIARIRAETAQRRSEAHVRTVVNSAPIALLAFDANGVITFEDGQALAAMGAKPGEHIGQSADEVYRDFPLMLRNVHRALKGEEFSSTLEFASTVFECRFAPLQESDGTPTGFIAVAHDVTERSRLQREILEISDREQARIGQDVHDGLCQQLIGMGFALNSLEESLVSQQRSESAGAAGKIGKLLDDAIDEARRVCRGLYPVRLSTQGLQSALEEMAIGASERYGVGCVCEPGADAPGCDVATATHLYRIAQEAVNNALKHSGARSITIRLSRAGGETLLEIKDDGKGIDMSKKPTGKEGMGLHIMEYRARLIGGTVSLHSDTCGTLVSCRVPQTL
ncbi:MAG TPA: PAS domain S-box protein [Candidatus Limnocylindrales bacterium]|jgi:PAS domain S-box-containing protein|nr:PAS domain S-box protein [Candidatus Limnocylindrales bacterium]